MFEIVAITVVGFLLYALAPHVAIQALLFFVWLGTLAFALLGGGLIIGQTTAIVIAAIAGILFATSGGSKDKVKAIVKEPPKPVPPSDWEPSVASEERINWRKVEGLRYDHPDKPWKRR